MAMTTNTRFIIMLCCFMIAAVALPFALSLSGCREKGGEVQIVEATNVWKMPTNNTEATVYQLKRVGPGTNQLVAVKPGLFERVVPKIYDQGASDAIDALTFGMTNGNREASKAVLTTARSNYLWSVGVTNAPEMK